MPIASLRIAANRRDSAEQRLGNHTQTFCSSYMAVRIHAVGRRLDLREIRLSADRRKENKAALKRSAPFGQTYGHEALAIPLSLRQQSPGASRDLFLYSFRTPKFGLRDPASGDAVGGEIDSCLVEGSLFPACSLEHLHDQAVLVHRDQHVAIAPERFDKLGIADRLAVSRCD